METMTFLLTVLSLMVASTCYLLGYWNANLDTLVSAFKAVGVGNMIIIVGEVGWPIDGDSIWHNVFNIRNPLIAKLLLL